MPDAQPLSPSLVSTAMTALEGLVDKLLELRVTTIIGAAHADATKAVNRGTETEITLDAGASQIVASTTINMALGDCTQLLDPAFVEKPEYAKLHQDAVALARTIRAETVAILTTLAKDVASHL
ncbi:MAG: hypothetical protein ABI369_04190 [Acetobacteraceae bacterium]